MRAGLHHFSGTHFILISNCEICISVYFSIHFNVENHIMYAFYQKILHDGMLRIQGCQRKENCVCVVGRFN